ncbi:uncharacterized protein [Haliotis asinina]|uniref:uncharacterized protein n=1 Tax=Haliotis asinina TaxID=109174 RepID=UPI0035322E84
MDAAPEVTVGVPPTVRETPPEVTVETRETVTRQKNPKRVAAGKKRQQEHGYRLLLPPITQIPPSTDTWPQPTGNGLVDQTFLRVEGGELIALPSTHNEKVARHGCSQCRVNKPQIFSLVFALPAEYGDKVGLSMTVLLSFGVFLTQITNNMPKTSRQTSYLTIYLTILLTLSSIHVVMSVVILRMHRRQGVVPLVLQKLVICWKCCHSNKRLNLYVHEHYIDDVNTKKCTEGPTWKDVAAMLDAICLRVFFIINITCGAIFFAILTISLVFALPAEYGDKVGLSMTVLLSFGVFLTQMTNNMPKTSRQTSYLTIYLTILLTLSSLHVVMSVVTLRMHRRQGVVPLVLQKLVIYWKCCNSSKGLDPHVQENHIDDVNTKKCTGCPVWKDVSAMLDALCLRVFFVINITCGAIFFTILTTISLVFALPAEYGDKVGLSMTVLLSFGVFLTQMTNNMPKTSRQTSYLTIYLTILLTLSSLHVVMSVVILRMHRQQGVVPLVLQKLVIYWKCCHSSKGLDPHVHENHIDDVNTKKCTGGPTWKDVSAMLDALCLRVFFVINVTCGAIFFTILTTM